MGVAEAGKAGQEIARNSSAREMARVTRNRVLALIDQAFDLMDDERRTGKRDAVLALVDAYHRDPLGYLARVRELDKTDEPSGKGAKPLNMLGLFVQAARDVAAMPAPSIGVQSGYIEVQATEIIDDNEW